MMPLLKNKIIICVGSGGVGKTTVAASLGILAAQQGLKTLVLTIDPSKRLATALGIEGSTDIVQVPGQNYPGQLWASVIDHKKTFDEFVNKAASQGGAGAIAEKILHNKLYQQLSTNLSGSQDFTSLEKLYSCVQSGKFDLVILDTPPSQHALDFLKAPQKLASLFDEKTTRWFSALSGSGGSLWMNLIQTGSRQIVKVLETLTGSQFVSQLIDFFKNIEQWQKHLYQRIVNFQKMLIAPGTQFCLVTSFDEVKIQQAEYLAQELRKGGHDLSTVIFNRSFPTWLSSETESFASAEVQDLYLKMQRYYQQKDTVFYSFQKQVLAPLNFYKIPDMLNDVSCLTELEKLSQCIQSWKSQS